MKGLGLGEALQLLSVVLVILGAIAGFIGTKLSDRGYVATFRLLATEIRQARTPVAPQWSPYRRVVSQGIPTGGVAARATIQIELESDDIRVPLMARVAANAAGDYATTVSGGASVVDQLLLEDATYY